MIKSTLHTTLTFSIASVWFVNGLFCKVLSLVPRHELIVARILGDEYSGVITRFIGVAEIGMAIWVLSGFKSRLNTVIQMVLIVLMNVLEFVVVPDLLLWARWNLLFALLLTVVIYFNEFVLRKLVQ